MSERATEPSRRPRAPAALVALLCAVLIAGGTWAIVMPPFQGPDEGVHLAYVESLATEGKLPGRPGREPFSSAVFALFLQSNADPAAFSLYAKPPWSEQSESAWERSDAQRPHDDGGGPSGAASYPPAYYGIEVLPYLAASGGSTLDLLYAQRLFSVLWLLVGTAAVWALAGELVGRRPALQLTAAATYGLWPMIAFMSSVVNPDGMLYALSSVVLWLGVKIVRRGLTPARGVGIALATGLACVTKASGIALVPGVLLVLAWGAWRLRDAGRMRALGTAAASCALLLVPIAAWTVVSRTGEHESFAQVSDATTSAVNLREFASYLWQFYLPKLGFMEPLRNQFPVISDLPAYNLWLGTSWGTFGWVNIWFPTWVYRIFLVITVAVAAGVLVTAWRLLRTRRPGRSTLWPALAFLFVVAACFLAGTHWSDYLAYRSGEPAFAQGRYLFPVAACGAVAVAVAVRALPARARALAVPAWLGFLVVFQIASLALVASRFYV